MSPNDYARAVASDFQISPSQSRHSGVHFEGLARYLQRTDLYEPKRPSFMNRKDLSDDDSSASFVSICNLDPSATRRYQHANSISDFENGAEALKTSEFGHLVFLKGHPSPEWILSIGARYQVDPEFFRRHLDFLAGFRDAYYSLPPLPSTTKAGFKLRSTTIGTSISTAQTDNMQHTLDQFRIDNRANLETYREKLRESYDPGLGDSIVRESSIHDLQHFSFEQDISVYVTAYYNSWAGMNPPSLKMPTNNADNLSFDMAGYYSQLERRPHLLVMVTFGYRSLADKHIPHRATKALSSFEPYIKPFGTWLQYRKCSPCYKDAKREPSSLGLWPWPGSTTSFQGLFLRTQRAVRSHSIFRESIPEHA